MSSFEGVKGIVPRFPFVIQESTELEHGGEGRGRGEFSLEDSVAFMHPNASVLQFSHPQTRLQTVSASQGCYRIQQDKAHPARHVGTADLHRLLDRFRCPLLTKYSLLGSQCPLITKTILSPLTIR